MIYFIRFSLHIPLLRVRAGSSPGVRPSGPRVLTCVMHVKNKECGAQRRGTRLHLNKPQERHLPGINGGLMGSSLLISWLESFSQPSILEGSVGRSHLSEVLIYRREAQGHQRRLQLTVR